MSETSEQSMPQEANGEHPTVTKVKAATEAVWEKQNIAQEYADIHKSITKDRLAWHGGGVYKKWVNDIDMVSKAITMVDKKSAWRKVVAGLNSGAGRVWAATTTATILVPLDIAYNVVTWPVRKILPRNLVKRSFLVAELAARNIALGAGASAAAIKFEGNIAQKTVKATTEAVLAAPEVIGTMAKRRIDKVVNKIMHPQKV